MQDKGQGIIAEQLMLAVSILVTIMIFLVISSEGSSSQEREIRESIDLRLGDLRKQSAVSTSLNDKMWRADFIGKGEYEDVPVYKIVSYYFSTPGDKIYLYDKQIPMSKVKEDLKTYFKFKMDKEWQEGPDTTNYFLKIERFKDDSERPDSITVKSYTPTGTGGGQRIIKPIMLADGTKAYIQLQTDKSQNINWGNQ